MNSDMMRTNQPAGFYSNGADAGQAAAGRPALAALLKKEADGEHPASHYLVVGDPQEPATWRLRVRDANGQPDHRLMGAAWAALHAGFRGERYEGPDKALAIAKLARLYESEGLTAPDGRGRLAAGGAPLTRRSASPSPRKRGEGCSRLNSSARGAKGEERGGERPPLKFVATLAEPEEKGLVRIPLAVTGTWVRGDQQFSITRRDLQSIARNFRARQNGEVNVDYDHASEMPEVAAGGPIPSAGRIVGIDEPEAAGPGPSVRSLEGARPDGAPQRLILWGRYEPTARARELIRRREYRYISPAIDWGARSKRTGHAQGATLTSVALTNRPFLEELPQIHLSDPAYRLIEEVRSKEQGARGGTSVVRRRPPLTRRFASPSPRQRGEGYGSLDLSPRHLQGGGQSDRTLAGQRQRPALEKRPDISDLRSQRGGSMKKVQISAAAEQPGEEGKVMIAHPDFADEYYADPEEVRQVLEDMGLAAPETEDADESSEAGSEAPEAGSENSESGFSASGSPFPIREIPLAEAAAVLSEAEAQGKAVPAAEFFRARVEQALDEAVKCGKILPRQRQDWRRIALADFPTFSKLVGEQPQRIPLRPLGFSGSAPVDVPTQVKFLAEQRMRERGVSFGQALTEIGREQPALMHEYRRAVSGE